VLRSMVGLRRFDLSVNRAAARSDEAGSELGPDSALIRAIVADE
jgi:hypothetical protein